MNQNPIHHLLVDIQSIVLYLLKVLTKSNKKYWWLNIIILLLCGTLTAIKLDKTKIYYKATAAFDYNFFYKKMYGDHLLDLKHWINEGKVDQISNELKISKESSSSLLDLHAYNIFGTALHEDFTRPKLTFYVDIKAENAQHSDELLKGILFYMNNIPMADKKVKEFQAEKSNELFIINKELEVLEDKINTSTIPNTTTEDLSQFFKIYEERNYKKIELNKTLNIKECITLVKKFNFSEVSKKEQLKPFIIKIFLLFLLSVFIITPAIYTIKDYKSDD